MNLFSMNSKAPRLPLTNNYWIADTARLVGDIYLEETVSVWFGAIIRGDNEPISIGSGTNIQENCILHTDNNYPLKVGSNCTIGHGAILHGCTIEDNCIIGMGAIVMNGAQIGKNCIVGARGLVTEEKKFLEKNKLILGIPAKVIRDLTSDELQTINESATSYQSKMRLFRDTLTRL